METAYLLKDNGLTNYEDGVYHRLIRIYFIYQRKKDPPYSMWYRYRKEGDVYTLLEDNFDASLNWIPDDEKRLEDGKTHKIEIVNRENDITPLILKGVKNRVYGVEYGNKDRPTIW